MYSIYTRCVQRQWWFGPDAESGGAAGAVPAQWWASLCSRIGEVQLSVLAAGMRGSLFGALCTGTGLGGGRGLFHTDMTSHNSIAFLDGLSTEISH